MDLHTPSPHDVRLAVVRLAGADPDDVGIRLRDGDVADREQPLVLEQRRERRAIARRLPHAAVRRADVPDRRVLFVDGEIGDAPRHGGRTDRSEVQLLELLRDGRRALREREMTCEREHRGRECDGANRASH